MGVSGAGKHKYVRLKDASEAEAFRRINNVFGPYLENLHPVHECSTLGLIRELEEALKNEFMGFGFVYHDILEPQKK